MLYQIIKMMRLGANWLGPLSDGTDFRVITDPSEAPGSGALPVLAMPFAAPATPGQPDPANAAGTVDSIRAAVGLVQSGKAAAVCTCPINKKVLQDGAGFAYPGHTEFLAHLGGRDSVVMMLACPELKVVPATIHIPLAEVPTTLKPAPLEQTIRQTHAAMISDFGLQSPRIAVAGLNPHAGEGGNMGREEITFIAPLIKKLQTEGMAIQGPFPGDTLFHAAARARYDVAVCMYHDQALIPIKTIDFASGVNVTLGLPFVRTSPDHGTAYDIAGRGVADARSLIAALRLAQDMAKARA